MKKLSNITESIWSDIRKRGIGNDIKQEDDIGNIKELIPVDMGLSVLWADKDFEIEDECYFNFNDAIDFTKNTGWRIPTKEEVKELEYTLEIKNTDEVYIIQGDFDDAPQLVFLKRGFKYSDIDRVSKEHSYNAWTSTKKDLERMYFMATYGKYSHMEVFNGMHCLNRLCVRLVKDRK